MAPNGHRIFFLIWTSQLQNGKWLPELVVPSTQAGAQPTSSDFAEKKGFLQTFAFVVLTAEALFTGTLT